MPNVNIADCWFCGIHFNPITSVFQDEFERLFCSQICLDNNAEEEKRIANPLTEAEIEVLNNAASKRKYEHASPENIARMIAEEKEEKK